jgi:hypothetical protein
MGVRFKLGGMSGLLPDEVAHLSRTGFCWTASEPELGRDFPPKCLANGHIALFPRVIGCLCPAVVVLDSI